MFLGQVTAGELGGDEDTVFLSLDASVRIGSVNFRFRDLRWFPPHARSFIRTAVYVCVLLRDPDVSPNDTKEKNCQETKDEGQHTISAFASTVGCRVEIFWM